MWHFKDGAKLKYCEASFEDCNCVFRLKASDYDCCLHQTINAFKQYPYYVKLPLTTTLRAKFETLKKALDTQLDDDVKYGVNDVVYLNATRQMFNQLVDLNKQCGDKGKPELLMSIKVRHIVFNETATRVKFILQRARVVPSQEIIEEEVPEEESKKKSTRNKRKVLINTTPSKKLKMNVEVDPVGIKEQQGFHSVAQESETLDNVEAFPAYV